ncbi:MAG TPA: class I SAM-dependent methyltransferase [Flavobacteriales bacterium]|jgi:methyltransferase (TIGR00027 family)|nr:class I SAM-dependent methyltransferase [Flavobacteriales bacterium]
MIEARPSLTAMMVAKRRAAHQLFDARPLVLDDPFAVRIIGTEAEQELRAAARKQQGVVARSGRAMMVARSRFAETEMERAMARGVRQYVVLGAGLDTFAYRNPHPPHALRVFEVDHPATQAWKRERLAATGIRTPDNVTYAAIDFEHQTLAQGLRDVGFDAQAPAFFSWLGVTMYLSEDAIARTFAFIAALPAGGGIALDYSLPDSSLSWVERLIRRYFARKVARMGEPFRTHPTPEMMHSWLKRVGFHHIVDLGAEEFNKRYFQGRMDGLRIGGKSLRVVSAEI